MSSSFPIPLNALRAIEIVARTQALGPAAVELGVTPGAVSQHIRRAEARLGVELFERTQDGMLPTAELEAVRPMLRSGFEQLLAATSALGADREQHLTLSVGNLFVSRWLVWRLPRFAALMPDIEIRLVTTGKLVDPARPDIDGCIRYGRGSWGDARTEPIGGRYFQPVCSPDLLPRLRTPADLSSVPVIDDKSTMLGWRDWFADIGQDMPEMQKGPSFTDPSLAFDAALSGQGVLMSVDIMAADALAAGRLVQPFNHPFDSGLQYWFVTDRSRHMPKRVRGFLDWMLEEIAATPIS